MTLADLPPYDGSMPLEVWRYIRAREVKRIRAQKSALMQARDESGNPLYRVTSGGNLSRTNPLSPTTRRAVIERDGECVWCGAGAPFDVDHITRYIDGGSNDLSNLQTLCERCHKSKGGR